MIRVVGHDRADVSGRFAGHAQREVVRPGTGAGEHHVPDLGREGREQSFGVLDHRRVHVPGVGVQQCRLGGDRGDDSRMGVPDGWPVVVGVEELLAACGVELGSGTSDEFDRMPVEQPVRATHGAFPPCDERAEDTRRTHDGRRPHSRRTTAAAAASRSAGVGGAPT